MTTSEDSNRFRLGKQAEALDAAATLNELGEAVVGTVRSLIHTNGVSFFPFIPGSPFGELTTFSHDEFASDLMRQQTLAMFPIIERDSGGVAALFATGKRALDLNTLLGPRGLEGTEMFNEYWRPYRLERQLLAVLGSAQNPLGLLCVSRSARQAAFRPRDATVLEKICEPLCGQLERLIRDEQEPCGPLPLALAAALPEPSVLFDSRGQLLWASAAAEKMFGLERAAFGWSASTAAVSEWRAAALDAILRRRTRPPEDVFVQRVEISPGVPVALITRRGRRDTIAERVFVATKEHRLTPRESEVLLRLASGLSNKEIANDLACSWRTVEVHVSNVLKKCGCTSRTELVAKL